MSTTESDDFARARHADNEDDEEINDDDSDDGSVPNLDDGPSAMKDMTALWVTTLALAKDNRPRLLVTGNHPRLAPPPQRGGMRNQRIPSVDLIRGSTMVRQPLAGKSHGSHTPHL